MLCRACHTNPSFLEGIFILLQIWRCDGHLQIYKWVFTFFGWWCGNVLVLYGLFITFKLFFYYHLLRWKFSKLIFLFASSYILLLSKNSNFKFSQYKCWCKNSFRLFDWGNFCAGLAILHLEAIYTLSLAHSSDGVLSLG